MLWTTKTFLSFFGLTFGFAVFGSDRLVSLAPGITSSVVFLGKEPRLVGVTKFCGVYLEGARKIPVVGGLLYPNREKIFALRPTLILASPWARYPWPGRIPVFTVGMENVRETVAGLRFLGRRLGREEKFLWWLSQMEKEKNSGRPMQVLFLFGLNKTFSAGRGSYVHDLVEFSGARNLSTEGRSAWPCLSREFVLASDPDRLVVAVPTEVYEDRFRWMERYRRDPFWGLLKAVKSHHLYFVDERNFLIPGPRFVEALRVLNCCWEI